MKSTPAGILPGRETTDKGAGMQTELAKRMVQSPPMADMIYRRATEFDATILAHLRIAFLKERGQGGNELVLRQTL